MRSLLATFSIICAAACSRDPLVLEVPFNDGDRSAVIAVEQHGNLEVYAIGDDQRAAMPVLKRLAEPSDGEQIKVTVLLYRRPLEEHDLQPGMLTGVPESPASRPLPNEGRIAQGTLGPTGQVEWQQLQLIPEPLSSFRIEGEAPCATLTGRVFDLNEDTSEDEWFGGAIALDGDTALVAATTEQFTTPVHFFEVDRNGTTRIETPAEMTGISSRALGKDRNGAIWVSGFMTNPFDPAPRIYKGDFQNGWTRVEGRPGEARSDWVRWLEAGGEGEDPGTMYTLSERGDLEKFTPPDRWEVLHLQEWETRSKFGGLAVVSPEEIFFILPGGSALMRWDGATREALREVTDIDEDLDRANDELVSMSNVPGFGLFAGTGSGRVLRRQENGVWTIFTSAGLVNHFVSTIVPFEAGMFITGRFGFVIEFDPIAGLCTDDAASLGSAFFVERLVALDGGWVAAGTQTIDAEHDAVVAGFVEVQ